MEDKINPQPQYQRGPVWNLPAKQLLIDSILCHFDIPKIYLHTCAPAAAYQYDVTDGQQRMRAIWQFLSDEFPLGATSYRKDAPWVGQIYSKLSKENRDQLVDFELIMAVISEASNDEVRELFSRLQRGMRLTPPELRNSIPSQLGDVIRSMADNHAFFRDKKCPFDDTRYQHRDLCALVFALLIYDGKRDIKAPALKEMFLEHAKSVPDDVTEKTTDVLAILLEIQKKSGWAVKTKWGFVDLCWYLGRHLDDKPDTQDIATRYLAFESRRRRHTANPQVLLEGGKVSAANTRLYTYIEAFKTSGGLAKNLRARHETFVAEFRKRSAKKRK